MIDTWRRFVGGHPRVIDAVLVLVLTAAAVLGSHLTTPGTGAPDSWWPGLAVTAVAILALLWRRGHPRAVTVVTGAAAIAVAGLGYIPTMLLIGPAMVALFSLATRTDRRTANTFALVIVVLLVCTALVTGPAQESIALKTVGPAAWLILPVALGTTRRLSWEYLTLMRSRAEHAERTREQEARHRVAEERMRIARDLHDVVAHHLALANAQAGTAAHIARTHPEQAREILHELTSTTSAALRELKATVGLLRRTDDPEVPTSPAPGLVQLSDLTESFASTGLVVQVETVGTPRTLDPGVDLTAYRIVQEALTNVQKHAATGHAQIELMYASDRITVTVTDEPASGATEAAASTGGGFGLIGMRERAHSVGGRLRAGRRPEGGFQVTAELPLHIQNPEREEFEEAR